MNKPNYLTQEQYNRLFEEIEEIQPSWRFIRNDRTIEKTMTVWQVWISAVINTNKIFLTISSNDRDCLENDEDLMQQVNDYIILIQL